jgi:hypothetical protein
MSKTRTTLLHLQSDGTVERYVKTVEDHLRKVVSAYQRDWDERLPIFLLACRASAHGTTRTTSASMMLGGKLRRPCDLLFGLPPTKSSPRLTTWWTSWIGCMTSVSWPVNILRWPVIKACYDRLANSAGYQEGDQVWLYRSTQTKGK